MRADKVKRTALASAALCAPPLTGNGALSRRLILCSYTWQKLPGPQAKHP